MAKRKKVSDMDIIGASKGIVVSSAVLGFGGSIVSGAGGNTTGISAAASFLPPIGAAIGAGLTVRQLKKLEKLQKRR